MNAPKLSPVWQPLSNRGCSTALAHAAVLLAGTLLSSTRSVEPVRGLDLSSKELSELGFR